MKRIKIFLFNGFLLTLTGLIMRSVDMLFNIYISNRIGSKAVGVYQLIVSVYIFFVTMANSGINLATTRIISEQEAYYNQSSIKKAMNKCILFSLFTGSFSCICLFLFAPFAVTYFLHNIVSEVSLQILGCSLPFLAISSCINGYFSGIRKVKKSVFYQLFSQFVKVGLATIFLNFIFPPVNVNQACISLVISAAGSEIISFLFLAFLFLKDRFLISSSNNRNTNFTKQILKIALPISFTSYIRSGLSSLKQVLIPLQLEKSRTCLQFCSFTIWND